MKQFTLLLLTLLTCSLIHAQDAAKLYTKNADAYRLKEVKYNSKKNDYSAVKFFDAVVFTSARSFRSKKQDARMDGKFVRVFATEKKANGKDRRPKKFMRDLKTRYNDGPICFNKENTMVYFSRNHFKNSKKAADGKFKYKLFESRLDRNGLDSVIHFAYNSNEYNIEHPSISNDGLTLYFSSDMPGGMGGMDIYYSRKSGTSWGTPVNLGSKVNTSGNEVYPFINAKDVLYFSSDGLAGMGGLDIFESKIVDGKGKKAYNMGVPLNSKYDDFGYFVTEGSGYISSNRKREGKDDDIYELDILREVKRGKDVMIVTKDKATGKTLANTKIVINSDTVITNEKGEFVLMAEEDVAYNLSGQKEDYFSASDNVSTSSSPDDEFTKEFLFEKDPKLSLSAAIKDAQSGEIVEGVSVKIKDLATNSDFDSFITTANGNYNKSLTTKNIGDKLRYSITLDKPGYLQKTVEFEYTINKPGEINLNEIVNLTIGKVAVGMDLSKMIEIKPIYFDIGKQTIRPDAAIELDKIVAIMTQYPNMSIELGSHTDCRSAASLNLKLSAQRAKASAGYIIKKGIAASRIVGKGYGETKLLNNCACEGKVESKCPEEEHTKNRRTEFVITKLQ